MDYTQSFARLRSEFRHVFLSTSLQHLRSLRGAELLINDLRSWSLWAEWRSSEQAVRPAFQIAVD